MVTAGLIGDDLGHNEQQDTGVADLSRIIDVETILVIEDDQRVQKALRRLFEPEGYVVQERGDGRLGVDAARELSPSAVVLDLRLPGMSGHDVCREIKSRSPELPIIILSATTDVVDKVSLLELGADDYVTKPFSPRELLARVRRAIRRRSAHAAEPTDSYQLGDVNIDFARMQVTRGGKLLATTAQEFKILKFLVQNPERVISREELLNAVWGYQHYPTTRTVDTHMAKLRQKLEGDPADPKHIITVHGVGYKFVP
jgi:DNA-binding response OmpR family regulator